MQTQPNQSAPFDDEEIFFHALELPEDQRAEFIAQQCGDNSELQEYLENLLAAHFRNRESARDQESEFILDRQLCDTETVNDPAMAVIAAAEGDTIDRYRLLEKIGEGGMGVVYLAQQVEGVQRNVALKIIKLGMDTRQVISRFEAERQAMAMFNHPNITRVLDVGATKTGRPYFVMELVRGTSITKFVDGDNLDLEQRLKLFVEVCNAVQHAHQKGIIHRDLKPSNILVARYDGVPIPKVIDFGIAKAVGQSLTDKTLVTLSRGLIGTPQYMSPEQAEMDGLDIDTRSDIYSLGALLYELITGTTPLSPDELRKINPLAVHQTLRDAEFESPSSRILKSTSKEASSPNAKRQSLSNHGIKGELDWIAMKALARDRTRRYPSATELAADIERYLNQEPVLAAPPSLAYRFQSMVRKNRTAAITAAVISMTLVAATITCSAFAINAWNANQQTQSVNQSLSIVNKDLVKTVNQLKTAESELLETAFNKEQRALFLMAKAKFDKEMEAGIRQLAKQMYPDPEARRSFKICHSYNPRFLCQLEHGELFPDQVSRLEAWVEEEQNKNHSAYSAYETDDFFATLLVSENIDPSKSSIEYETEIKHTPQCNEVSKKFNQQLLYHQPEFFALLAAEYQHHFGNDAPQVAVALNMLAASLIQAGDFEKAERVIGKASKLARGEDQETTYKLLEILRKERLK